MDWIKSIKSGLKYFGIAVLGVVVASLGAAVTGYKPDGPLEVVIMKFLVAPGIIGLCGLMNNIKKHWKS